MIIFRTDASPQIGFGHLTRCRALAMALRSEGKRCVMVGPAAEYAKSVDQETFEDWIPAPEWSSANEDGDRLIGVARKFEAEWLVLDDYRIDETYQLRVREAGLRWLQFDGTASNPLWADIVLNANPAARSEDYQPVLRNPNARLLLGPRYAILRPEFDQIIPREPGRPVKKILLTFGGGDDRGANKFVLSTLLPVTSKDQEFVVITGATNPSNPSLKRWIDAHGQGRVSLHIDPEQVAPLFASCDLAVMAGGTSTYEAARCGLPMILIAIADNQIAQVKGWMDAGAALYLGMLNDMEKSQIHSCVNMLVNDHEIFINMGIWGIQTVQGRGSVAVAEKILESIAVDESSTY